MYLFNKQQKQANVAEYVYNINLLICSALLILSNVLFAII